jgi:hypothetical protein
MLLAGILALALESRYSPKGGICCAGKAERVAESEMLASGGFHRLPQASGEGAGWDGVGEWESPFSMGRKGLPVLYLQKCHGKNYWL